MPGLPAPTATPQLRAQHVTEKAARVRMFISRHIFGRPFHHDVSAVLAAFRAWEPALGNGHAVPAGPRRRGE